MLRFVPTILLSATFAAAQDPGPAKPRDMLTIEQIVSLLKAGAGRDALIRDIRGAPGKYRTTDDDVVKLREAGAPRDLLDVITGEKAEPVTVDELIEISKMKLADIRKDALIRWRPLAFPPDDYESLRRLAIAGASDMLQVLRRRGERDRPDYSAGGTVPENVNPGVVIKDWTVDVNEARAALFTFTIENQFPHGVKGLRVRTDYKAKVRGEVRSISIEESADLGELEPYERRRWRAVRLHRNPVPVNAIMSELTVSVTWVRDDTPARKFGRFTLRDVERALLIGDQVSFLDTDPVPEWHHRFTLVNRGAFPITDLTLLLRIFNEEGRVLWYHEHTVPVALAPGAVLRDRIETVNLSSPSLWNRVKKEWVKAELKPTKAELVVLRGVPGELPGDIDSPRALDVLAELEVLHGVCSWIGAANPAATVRYVNFTVVNPHAFALRDLVVLVRFRDAAGVPLNYEAVLKVPGTVGPREARHFERIIPEKFAGYITEGDRAASAAFLMISATPARPVKRAPAPPAPDR